MNNQGQAAQDDVLARLVSAFAVALIVCLAYSAAPAWANLPEACGTPGGLYGDGSDGDVVISTDEQLVRDMNYRYVTVEPGVTLDTAGFTLRVCGALVNHGIVTDTVSGGRGGAGGAGGLGGDPISDTPGCPGNGIDCTPGQPGEPGEPPTKPQAGAGGQGGGGGGGGGGAWYKLGQPGEEQDADGGDGGDGGSGGNGGGYVRIYVLRLYNYGVIRADGLPGNVGQPAPGPYDPNDPNDPNGCGAEYNDFRDPPNHLDIAGGGGGGGGGGCGGDGGTVEIRYAYLGYPNSLDETHVHASGGNRGVGASGGLSGTSHVGHCLTEVTSPDSDHGPGCSGGGTPQGGIGGRGAHEQGDCAVDGDPGQNGTVGLDGAVILDNSIHDCNRNGVPDECDVNCHELLILADTAPVTLYTLDLSGGDIPTEVCTLPEDVTNGAGLAQDPRSGRLYAALDKADGHQWFALLDLECQVTDIGILDPSMDAITFCDDGTLYAVSGGGRIYLIDPKDGTVEDIGCNVPPGPPYEIACQPGSGHLYYASHMETAYPWDCFPYFGWIDAQACEVHPVDPNNLPPECFPEIPGPMAFCGEMLFGYGDQLCHGSICFEVRYYIDQSDGCWYEESQDGICVTAMTARRNSGDCNGDGIPDECELGCDDCNGNRIPDQCEIANDPSLDVYPEGGNGIIDTCDEDDCNGNSFDDMCDISCEPADPCAQDPDCGLSQDFNNDGLPDECECLGDIWPWTGGNPPCGDGQVDLSDLAVCLQNYGKCEYVWYCDGDLNCDGCVNLADLAELLSRYGDNCD